MPDWVLRQFEPELGEKINRAFNKVFRQTRSLEEWKWKFLHCPWGQAILTAESVTGELLAHFAALPIPFQAQGSRRLVGQGVDAFRTDLGATLPGEQNVYRATARAFFELYCRQGPFELLYGLAGRRHSQVLVSHLGWTAVGTLPAFEAMVTGQSFRSFPRRLLLGLNLELWERLWHLARERFSVIAWRDEAFVRWRYLLHPDKPYRFLFGLAGEEASAVAVLRVCGYLCYLVDLLWDGRSPGVLRDLLCGVGFLAKDWGCKTLRTWLHGDPLAAQVLCDCGWVPSQAYDEITVTAISARANLDPRNFWENAFFSMADGDLV